MMMDPAVKTALAFCVLLAGFCAATLLRNNKPATAPRESAAEQLLIRARGQAPAAALRPRRGGRTGCQAVPADGDRPPTVVTPSDRREAPPPLAPDYPGRGKGDRSNLPERPGGGHRREALVGAQIGPVPFSALPGGAPAEQSPRTHKIVNGDTLPALAQRYLGSASRAGEIFAANRDVLPDPELLPIGVELKIPPRRSRAEPAPSPRPLAPVPHPR